jgi:predicted N-acetyltransferase YhbS
MTFGSPARAHTAKGKKVLEMKRLAGELNTIITGGASKLFKLGLDYAKQNGYEIVKSYCDLRWGTGNLYAKLGFIKTHETKYTPHYTNGTKRFRNQNLAQNKQKTGTTEKEIASKRGLYKIYDCGHQTWEHNI